MKVSFTLLAIAAMFASCYNPFNKTVKGNGNIKTEERNLPSFDEIKCAGSYNVELTQGNSSTVKIETDENLLPYIETKVNGDELVIRTEEDVNILSFDKVKVYITTNRLERFKLSGSGDIKTTNKFTGGDHLNLDIAGSGSIHFDVNTPTISSSISGSGDIYLSGETKDSRIDIAGSGNYHADDLKAENVTVKIAGSGDAWLFADSQLDINIAGIGNVYYRGNATVNKNIAGSGKIEKKD
ncbi:head GIN domain-containing protein [Parafilimonas sp.]|uniref:head GIN domain-containing protein n=1 Tax=Parafilimonas sp. TaxID=1969739 RepID=UPI0039E31616